VDDALELDDVDDVEVVDVVDELIESTMAANSAGCLGTYRRFAIVPSVGFYGACRISGRLFF
jgi:hypothetical protein